MKTVIDLPEDLLESPQSAAAYRQTSVSTLVIEGLETVLREETSPSPTTPPRFQAKPSTTTAPSPSKPSSAPSPSSAATFTTPTATAVAPRSPSTSPSTTPQPSPNSSAKPPPTPVNPISKPPPSSPSSPACHSKRVRNFTACSKAPTSKLPGKPAAQSSPPATQKPDAGPRSHDFLVMHPIAGNLR